MTPQEALAQAILDAADPNFRYPTKGNCDRFAAAILAALPEGWVLVGANTYRDSAFQVGIRFGAQQERERLLPLFAAVRDHVRFLNDENTDPLLEGHSIGCRVIQRPDESNNHTTGTQHVGDCAANHRQLVSALALADPDEADR